MPSFFFLLISFGEQYKENATLCSQLVREKLAENISKVLQSIYFPLKRAIGVTSACKTQEENRCSSHSHAFDHEQKNRKEAALTVWSTTFSDCCVSSFKRHNNAFHGGFTSTAGLVNYSLDLLHVLASFHFLCPLSLCLSFLRTKPYSAAWQWSQLEGNMIHLFPCAQLYLRGERCNSLLSRPWRLCWGGAVRVSDETRDSNIVELVEKITR